MYALVIGRAYPDQKTGMMGIFEFEHALALNNAGVKTVYAFCDTRSIKLLRTLNYTSIEKNNVPVYGYHFPIGGISRPIFEKLKERKYKRILKKILENHGIPDIIHVHYPLLNLTDKTWEMLKSLNRPIAITEHWSKVQTQVIEPYRQELLKKIVNEADTFMCVGEQLKKSIIELTNTEKDILIMPNMVKPIFYYYEKERRDDNFHFVTIGRLVENKRVGLVIEAFSKAFKGQTGINLHIVGDGPLFNSLKHQIETLDMNDQITMYGFISREETAELIRSSDAFVSASILETFGVPFIEAMACGKPVIGIKNGPINYYINETNGIMFEQDNLEDLIKAFNKVYNLRDRYDGKLISNTAQILFSEKSVTKKIISIYKHYIKH